MNTRTTVSCGVLAALVAPIANAAPPELQTPSPVIYTAEVHFIRAVPMFGGGDQFVNRSGAFH